MIIKIIIKIIGFAKSFETKSKNQRKPTFFNRKLIEVISHLYQ